MGCQMIIEEGVSLSWEFSPCLLKENASLEVLYVSIGHLSDSFFKQMGGRISPENWDVHATPIVYNKEMNSRFSYALVPPPPSTCNMFYEA